MRMVWFVLMLLLFSNVVLVFNVERVKAGSDIYIATDGDDVAGDGSIGNPYHTFNKALSEAAGGDTIYVRGGVYLLDNESNPTNRIYLNKNNITIKNYTDEVPVLDGTGVQLGYGYGALNIGISTNYNNNITIDGINISNIKNYDVDSAFMIYCVTPKDESRDIFIYNCSFYNCSHYAVQCKHNDKTHQMQNIQICNCTFDHIETSESSGEGVAFTGVNNGLFENNLMTDCTKTYVDLAQNSSNITVRYNRFYNNGTMNTVHAHAAVYVAGGQAVYPDWSFSRDHRVYNNYIQMTDGTGISINCERTGTRVDNVSVYNNIVKVTSDTINRYGIGVYNDASVLSSPLSNITFKFNTVYLDGSIGGAVISPCLYFYNTDVSDYYDVVVANNIFVSNVTGTFSARLIQADDIGYPPDPDNIIVCNNLYNHSTKNAFGYWDGDSGTLMGDDYVISSPLFVNAPDDLQLTGYSPAINNANSSYTIGFDYNNDARPNETGNDIGAYEYFYTGSGSWWDSNWGYKKMITIDKDQVPGDLVNFPVFINLSSDVDLASNAQSDGDDIVFVNESDTFQYNHEIEYYDSVTGRLVAWVNITSLSSSSDTILYMYYGNSDCGDQSNASGVWDSNYIAVYHMTGANVNAIVDSTVNGFDATSENSNPTYNQEAICGKGVQLDGNNDYITFVDDDLFTFASGGQDSNFTVEAVFQKTDNNNNLVISKYQSEVNREWMFYAAVDSRMRLFLIDKSVPDIIYRYSTDSISNDRFYYCAASYDGSETYQGIIQYINGTNNSGTGQKQGGYVAMENTDAKVRIGYFWGLLQGYYYKGIIDEVRMSRGVERSADWIETTYNTIFNGTSGGFFALGSESVQGIFPPTGFQAVTEADGDIYLNWTDGVNTTHTRVEWNTVSNWPRGSGTLLFNDSVGTDVTHINLGCGSIYYYLAWGWNSSSNGWSSSVSAFNISCPGNPSDVDTFAYPSALNISWILDDYADTTLVIRKSGSYPSSVTDGTEVCNITNTSWNDTGIVYGTHYYKLYSYNSTVNRYSTGVEIEIGSLNINVYDENTSNPVVNWDVFISNEEGTQVYESMGNSNTLVINIDDLPLGDVTIIVNASDYVTRIFSLNLEEGTSYFLDCYLAWNDSTEQYVFSVVGPQNEYGYEPPVEGATIYFKRYINETVGWGNASIRKTSASGTVIVGLIPKAQYHITIVKSGYETFYDVIVPPPVELEGDRYFIFRLIKTSGDLPVYDDFWDLISFTAVMTSPGYLQDGNITLSYSDSNTSTVNTRTYLYEVLNNTITLKDDYYQTGDSFSRKIGNINTTRYHYVLLYFNNTASFTLSSPVMIPVYSLHKYMDVEPLDLNARITNVIGSPPVPGIPWSGHIAVVIPIMVLVLLGVFNTGIGIVGCGLSIGMVQGLYAGYGISVNLGLFALAPLVIVIGVIYIWSKRQGSDML